MILSHDTREEFAGPPAIAFLPYPEGAFVALARVRLEAIKQDAVTMRDPHDREIELSFWESVRESDNPALIKAYLEKYPNGEFSPLARIRVDELTPDRRTA
jgi:adenylate cyclase